MTESARRYLVAYDVEEDGRRTRLARLLESFGYRAQYSVFILDIRPARAVKLWSRIEQAVDLRADSILVCDLGPTLGVGTEKFWYLGVSRELTPDGPIIV